MISITRQGINAAPVPAMARVAAVPRDVVAPKAPNAADRAIKGASSKALTREQKTRLILVSKRAWEKVRKTDDSVGGFDSWRAAQSIEACKRRISEARNEDFEAIESHFLNILGEAGKALNQAIRSGTSKERQAMKALEKVCAERELSMAYPAAICKNQYKCALSDASPKQLWNLVFTIRNRRSTPKAAPAMKPAPVAPATPDQPQERAYTLETGDNAKKYERKPRPQKFEHVDLTPPDDEEDPF